MRQQANKHILERRFKLNPNPVFDALMEIYQDTVNYDRLIYCRRTIMILIDHLRESLGLDHAIGQLEFIDIDSYTPDQFSH